MTASASGAAVVPSGDTSLEFLLASARAWLDVHCKRRSDEPPWGAGDDSVAVFGSLSREEEAAQLQDLMSWQQQKFDAGFGAISWPTEFGGAGLPPAFQDAFEMLEYDYGNPHPHELFEVTRHLVAPTVLTFGSAWQKTHLMPLFLRTTELCCQLFSEPQAGSDLASILLRADRDGDDWIISGHKTWTSGAPFAAYGELIARTGPADSRQRGLTAFLVPLDTPGISIRPIRQMTGGASFNEVYFDGVRLPDDFRLGEIGEGWKVALATLGFERERSGLNPRVGGSWHRVQQLAHQLGAASDPIQRQRLAQLYIEDRILQIHNGRLRQELRSGPATTAASSATKLMWSNWLNSAADVVSGLLGPRLLADTGAWGTYCWAEHVLGAVGYRIAGGTDEMQRNAVAHGQLGLPRDPR